MLIRSLQLQKKTCRMPRSRGFGRGVVVSRTCWGIFRSPMFPCDRCKTMMNFDDWAFNDGGLEVGMPAFQLPMFAKCDAKWGVSPAFQLSMFTKFDYCRWREESRFTCLFSLRNLSRHSLPVAWCSGSWFSTVYYHLPLHHHVDSFAAKELLPPLLSPRTIVAHRIQSTTGRIWPLIERFDRCAAVPCDSALIWWRSIALVASKIQDFAEFDGISSLCKGSW